MEGGFEFLQPGWLLCLPLVLLSASLVPWLRKHGWLKKNKQLLNIAVVRHPQAKGFQDSSAILENRSLVLVITICCLFFLALAQPVRPGDPVKTPATSADIILLIDTSISMVMKDYMLDGQRVDRMTMTQVLLDRFSRQFTGKRMGIVLLGDQAQILLSPSKDKALVRYMIRQLRPTVAGRQAALGDAIAIATDYIHSDQITDETILVLISSADAPAGQLSPVAGVERAIETGTVLHTITIGSTDMQESQMGELIFEPADLRLMQQLAEKTGGKSFHAVDVETMDTSLRSIEQHHQTIADNKNMPHLNQSLYHWPLLTALLLLILSTVIFSLTNTALFSLGRGLG